jgi:hypothetical protein
MMEGSGFTILVVGTDSDWEPLGQGGPDPEYSSQICFFFGLTFF